MKISRHTIVDRHWRLGAGGSVQILGHGHDGSTIELELDTRDFQAAARVLGLAVVALPRIQHIEAQMAALPARIRKKLPASVWHTGDGEETAAHQWGISDGIVGDNLLSGNEMPIGDGIPEATVHRALETVDPERTNRNAPKRRPRPPRRKK